MNTRKIPSLSYKLYKTFTISFILPVLFVCLCISGLFGTYQFRTIRAQTEQNTQLISAYMNKYIQDIDNIMRAPFSHSYLQSKIDLQKLSNVERHQLSVELGSTLNMTAYSRDDFGDLLFLSNQEVIYFNAENYYQYLPTATPLAERNWYLEAIRKDGKIAFSSTIESDLLDGTFETNSFYISRRLKNLRVPEQENIILINMRTSVLDDLFSKLNQSHPTLIILTNDQGDLIYSNLPINKKLMDHFDKEMFFFSHDTWVHNSNIVEAYDLTVHVLFSANYITKQIGTYFVLIIACYLLCVITSCVLFFNKKWIRTPVIHILSTLKILENGDLDARCDTMEVQEFNDIAYSINAMAHQLQEKIKNEYELTLNQQNLQFQALQSQIQPHFIINTIYSFITLNQIGERDLLNDYLYAFTHLLRYVLRHENETTLGKELDFLKNYCSLHHLRFGQRFLYQIECPEHLRSLTLPKLLLQPLVENAVVHGIEPSIDPCTLNIEVKEVARTLYIIIEDSGVGFTKEEVNASTSIGIKNVETRIGLWNKNVQLFMNRLDSLSVQVLVIPLENEELINEDIDH